MSRRRMVAVALFAMTLMLPGMTPAHAGGQPQCSPFRSTIQARLSTTLNQQMRLMHLPGIVVNVTVPGQGCWSVARGLAVRETRSPMRLDDHMRIGSITKSMTLTVILMLMDRGRLGLDDPISKYVSGVPNGRNITLRELGDMRSGLFNYSEDKAWDKEQRTHPYRLWTPEQLLAYAWRHKPYFAPNKGWHYSNTNTVLLGLVIRKLTGRPVPQVFSQWLYRPLGMNQTFLATNSALPAPYANGYSNATLSGRLENVTHWNPSWGWTAGSAVSTLHDLVIWTNAIGHGALLSRDAQRQRLAAVPIKGTSGPAYGLGVLIVNGWIWHNGNLPGYSSWMGYYSPSGATISLSTNTEILYHGRGPGDLVANALAAVITPGHSPFG